MFPDSSSYKRNTATTMLESSHSRPYVAFRGAAAVAITDGALVVADVTTAGEVVVDGEGVDCEERDARDEEDWAADDDVSGEGDGEVEVGAGAVVETTSDAELVEAAGTLTLLTTVPLMPVCVMVAVATGWPSE